MIAFLGFIAAAALTVPIACYLARQGKLRETELPWNLLEVASRQLIVLGGLAGFAVTAIVLLVTFARDRAGAAPDSFNAVVTMFLAAYFFYVGTSVLMGYMPREDALSPLRPRIQFVLASILQYRTIFLGWFAMKPLLETFNLDVPAQSLEWLLGLSAVLGTFFTGSIFQRVGVLETREVFQLPLLAMLGVVLYLLSILVLGLEPSEDSAMHLAIAFFLLNTLTFVHFTAGVVASGLPAFSLLLERYARYLLIADFEATTVLIVILFLAVLEVL